ncbi:ATP-dependent protease LonB [Chengkuizengella axinellae]|uniref:Archaeal Lon protease n=1 Tax=Chengkuizengella axinellae TaxID=3064388 RepID=A0ABT9J2X4_9BACL|nr:ATP-dependent protease LonB [Chengkuizengella sp. 2205SS18-9]MDP5275948.1 ATP-dependent protease LonB [Chengkuizengella sp. 2205SS18-9]
MNNVMLKLFSAVMHRLAVKHQVVALEQTISLFLKFYKKQPDKLFSIIVRFSEDSRWVLRYLSGRELGKFFEEKPVQIMEIWFKLASDDNLYVREGAAKGITYAAGKNVIDVWGLWEKAFSHPSEEVRQTAAMTLLSFIEKHKDEIHILPVIQHAKKDTSPKVKMIMEKYISPLMEQEDELIEPILDYQTTEELPLSSKMIDQVVGQDQAVEIIKIAARQKRSVLLIGEPGTGKSMLGQAISELLPVSKLEDVIVESGGSERNVPKIKTQPAGKAAPYIRKFENEAKSSLVAFRWMMGFVYLAVLFVMFFYYFTKDEPLFLLVGFIVIGLLYFASKKLKTNPAVQIPKILVDHTNSKRAPFIDATGLHAGALLGDIRHDPYQSGGLEAMPHQLVESGAIHQAHQGVLYIDEVSTLSTESQQFLLTAFQEKKLPITGRSLGSSGSMIRTEAVPTDFIMVLAGNVPDVDKIHPALRSRIQGYGYEIYTKTTMEDTPDNRYKLAQFVSQEVRKDRKIPHFTREAVHVVIGRAKEMSPHSKQLTTRFRELGGLIRTAGDIAVQSNAQLVSKKHVEKAMLKIKTLEEQMWMEVDKSRFSTPYSQLGMVQTLLHYKGIIGQVSKISLVVQSSEEVELQAPDWLTIGEQTKLEALLYQKGLFGKYYIQKNGMNQNDESEDDKSSREDLSLGILVASISIKKNIMLVDFAVCGHVDIMGTITGTSYFESKVKTAARQGIKKIIAPLDNAIDDIPKGMEVFWVKTVDEVEEIIVHQFGKIEAHL